MKHSFYRSLFRKLGPGFTLMVIPNSSDKITRSWRIPFVLALVILGIIAFNIYVLLGYTTQIWQINRFHQRVATQDETIAKLRSEKPRVDPTLEKSRNLEGVLAQFKTNHHLMNNTWKRVRKKGKYRFSIASRGSFGKGGDALSQILAPMPVTKSVTTSLEKLSYNLGQLEKALQKEIADQKRLLQDLQARERLLDHTPTLWPVYTAIAGRFGMRFHPVWRRYRMHSGTDLRADFGTKVRAAADGVVSFAGWDSGYGYLVKISHDYGYETRYGHNSRLLVHSGQTVKKGQIISLSGSTGVSTGPHLHYEVRINSNPVNPAPYLQD